MTIDGEIPTSYFLIISIGLTILSYLVYKKNGKSLEVYFLSILTISNRVGCMYHFFVEYTEFSTWLNSGDNLI